MFRLLLLLMLVPVLLLLGCQTKLIYYPSAYNAEHRHVLVKHQGLPLEYVTGQGKQVAHYIPPKNGQAVPKTVWLCFAGNASLGLNWLHRVGQWDPGFAYLLVDYPGYGDCEGSPSPAKIRESSNAAVAALAAHLKEPVERLQPRLGVLAHSIGCAAGLMAAADLHIENIVLIAPFTTLTDMGKRILGWPLCYVNMHRFDNRKTLAQVVEQGARVVIFHGTKDEVIPVSMSRELAAAHPGKVILHEKEGWDHNHILAGIAEELGVTMAGM
ncbi:alpha/beta fold hydrolase [Prosthecobacter sp. SYSU 5D2]|uniref:alpha/beta hydrolase n=1 Tax=Prosthecobacter sp. SYSU 5D2 TaxID=3134134 RepID=UPI0031FF23F2